MGLSSCSQYKLLRISILLMKFMLFQENVSDLLMFIMNNDVNVLNETYVVNDCG